MGEHDQIIQTYGDLMKKVALITGGTRGIGLGISFSLARQGFDLAVNDVRREDDVQDVIDQLKGAGTEVVYCQGDIAMEADREKILGTLKIHYDKLNVLVNNAGVAPLERKGILETTIESYDRVMDINLKGSYFLTQTLSKWMIEQAERDTEYNACIINITSISSTVASVNRGEYCISKAGMSMMSKLFAVRLGEYDIPVYEVQPGMTRTDMTECVRDTYDKLIADGQVLQKRWGMPEDIGKTVAALAAGNFPYSTGSVIMVDGGLTVPRL